jgi:hypothetical protein
MPRGAHKWNFFLKTGSGTRIDTLTYNISLRHHTRFTHKDRQRTKTLYTTEANVAERRYAVVTPSDVFKVRVFGYLKRRPASRPAQNSQGQCTHQKRDRGDSPDNGGVQTLQRAEPDGTSYLSGAGRLRWKQWIFSRSHRFCSACCWGHWIENRERVARRRNTRWRRGDREVIEREPKPSARILEFYTKAVAISVGPKG